MATTLAVRTGHGEFHRSVLVLAPVIMTGTVHRPMELTVVCSSPCTMQDPARS